MATEEEEQYWRNKPLRPSKVLINDIGIENKARDGPRKLELTELWDVNSLVERPHYVPLEKWHARNKAEVIVDGTDATQIERQRLLGLAEQYSWLQQLRIKKDDPCKQCRWIHVSSKLPENIKGVFVGLSDWMGTDSGYRISAYRRLNTVLQEMERFSKHGKFFAPDVKVLSSSEHDTSMFASCPFLDWTVRNEPVPPLRFQVDERERLYSARNFGHPLRTLLQHHYRLEDTEDREQNQVYNRYRPWLTNRDIDLKIRRFYGHYPTGLAVDELWILVVDSQHIVTFSSNQTWKSRWPPLQVSSRISEIAFRRIRELHFETGSYYQYTSLTHAAVCVYGAVGLLHRSFWSDMPLPCADRYSGYMSHLQYRLYRAPSTKLVMELLQVNDELHIVLSLMKAQLAFIKDLSSVVSSKGNAGPWKEAHSSEHLAGLDSLSRQPAYRGPTLTEELQRQMQREFDDLGELQTNCNMLVNRTVQLVNIRLEGHGQAVLVFTIVTVVFLPLSFVTSFFGMNTSDIRNMDATQAVFWLWGCVVTAVVLLLSCLLAFYGGALRDRALLWRQRHPFSFNLDSSTLRRSRRTNGDSETTRNFVVLDSVQVEGAGSLWK